MVSNSKNVLYAKFKTKENYYIYDTYSNNILQVSKVTWDIIEDYLKNPDNKDDLFNGNNYKKEEILDSIREIEEGRNNGYMQSANIKVMSFFDDGNNKKIIEEIKHSIPQLTLEVTQNCNYRCKYCVYSGYYSDFRSHKNRNMEWETAINAINIFIKHSSKVDRRSISFYGGEPLLNFDLIKEIVNYIKEHYPNKNIHYNFTTNGSLFNDENIEFFIKNNFHILISLDGPQHIHDKYRVDIKGNGTFNRVMQGLQKIIAKDKEYYNKMINFNCILTPNTNYSDVNTFFSENKLFEDKWNISISMVDSFQNSFFDKYGYFSSEQSIYLNKFYFEAAINNLLEKEKFIRKIYEKDILTIFHRCIHKISERVYPNGCCIPLNKKMFVDINGNIHTCERVPFYNPLGNVNTNGIDYNLIMKFVEEYIKNSLKDCKQCWAVRMCPACYKYFMKNHKWNDYERDKTCKRIQKSILNNFILYSLIIETNPKAFEYMKEIELI